MVTSVRIPNDKEFKKELKEILGKPEEWYLERVDRAVRGARVADRRNRRVPAKN